MDLMRRLAAGLRSEVLDDGATGAAVPKALRLKAAERLGTPRGVVIVHVENDTNSH